MQKKTNILVPAVFVMLLFYACQSIIDFPDVPEVKPVTIIEGILTDRAEVCQIRVSRSVSLGDSISSIPVPDAEVFVYSDNDTFYYTYKNNGRYESEPFGAEVNRTYHLEVRIDSSCYKSTGTVLPLNGIDSIYTGYFPKYQGDDSAYMVYINAGDINFEKTGYYLVNAFRNGKCISTGSDLWVFDDKHLNDLNSINIPYTFRKNDTVTVELNSISKEMYDYYYVLVDQFFVLNYQNIWYKTNPPLMFDGSAMGYFQVSSVSSKTVIVR